MVKKKKSIKRNNQKKLFSIVGAILLVLAGITIAYAALSATLNITINKVTQNAEIWNVAFDTTAVTPTKSRTGVTCPNVTPTALAVQIGDVALDLPGDKCTYALTVKNTGTIDATLSTVTKLGSVCGSLDTSTMSFKCGASTGTSDPYILVKLASNTSGTALTTGGTLAKSGGTQPIYLILEHNPSATTTVSTTANYSNIGFQLTYGQK